MDEVLGLVGGHGTRPAQWHPEYPTADSLDAAGMLLAAYEASGLDLPAEPVWWLFGIVCEGVLVGDAGFHGPPGLGRPVAVEIGYQVVPAWRRRGVATAACGLLLAHAWGHGADVVVADADPGNLASRAVLRSHGFRPAPGGGFILDAPRREAAWTA